MEAPFSLIYPEAIDEVVRLARMAPAGRIAEVGVYRGGSAWHLGRLAEELGEELHLFDTFTGIPFQGPFDHHKVGDFGGTSEEEVRRLIPGAIFHVGVFPATLPKKLKGFGFVHVDCDQYQSVRDCITHLGPRMAPDGIMVFDDYGHLEGANRAVHELLGKPFLSLGGRYHWVF